jgi:hypothetical protein
MGVHEHPRWPGVPICCVQLDQLIKQLLALDRGVTESQAKRLTEIGSKNGYHRQARWAREAGLKRMGTPID